VLISRFVTGYYLKARHSGVWLNNCRWLFNEQVKVPVNMKKKLFSGGWSPFVAGKKNPAMGGVP
jgi:hypothetical protein